MRSRPTAVPPGRADGLLALLEQAEASADALTSGELLEAIGRTARLEAVLRARYAALAASASTSPAAAPLPEAPRYLDAATAAGYLGVSKSTVLRLAKAGVLPVRRPSEGIIRFGREDLDTYMGTRR